MLTLPLTHSPAFAIAGNTNKLVNKMVMYLNFINPLKFFAGPQACPTAAFLSCTRAPRILFALCAYYGRGGPHSQQQVVTESKGAKRYFNFASERSENSSIKSAIREAPRSPSTIV